MSDRDPSSFADIHSHLVPGVDDGAREVEDTLRSVERMTRLGIRKIITTPHLNGSLTHDKAALEDRLGEVDEAWDATALIVGREFPEIDFRRGHEVMLDVPDVDFSDPRMRLAGTSFVLIEWPRLQVPPGTKQVLERIVEQGFRPVVAHPERYMGLDRDLAVVGSWRETGALLQMNSGSLVGRYGSEARGVAERLLRRGWIDYMATDFHAQAQAKLYVKEARAILAETGAGELFQQLCLTNPARIFRDEPPLPVQMLPVESGFWAKIKSLLHPEEA